MALRRRFDPVRGFLLFVTESAWRTWRTSLGVLVAWTRCRYQSDCSLNGHRPLIRQSVLVRVSPVLLLTCARVRETPADGLSPVQFRRPVGRPGVSPVPRAPCSAAGSGLAHAPLPRAGSMCAATTNLFNAVSRRCQAPFIRCRACPVRAMDRLVATVPARRVGRGGYPRATRLARMLHEGRAFVF